MTACGIVDDTSHLVGSVALVYLADVLTGGGECAQGRAESATLSDSEGAEIVVEGLAQMTACTVVVDTEDDGAYGPEPVDEGLHECLRTAGGSVGDGDDVAVAAGQERETVFLAFGDDERDTWRVAGDGCHCTWSH